MIFNIFSSKDFEKKEGFFAFFGLLALLFIFYPSLFLALAAPLTGDHLEQHYPWAFFFSECLRHGQLPFWTSRILGGFPIAAESQIGLFYVPNVILYLLLPLKVAYSWMNPLHFLLSGFGTYLFARHIGIRFPGAFMCAVLFVFGGAFGGAYYNMTSLKTIAWFPLGLYLLELMMVCPKKRHVLFLGAAVGMSLVAGYLQIAVFTWLVFTVYSLTRIFFFRTALDCSIRATFIRLCLAAFIAVLIALPQVLLTYELSLESNRVGLDENYAYVGSLSPFIFTSFLLPTIQYVLRGNNMYCGLIGLFFVLFAIVNPECRKISAFKKACFFIIFSLLLALGRWSPLYVILIKLTHFYSFRMPAKFIGFTCFGFALLGGLGFDAIWKAVHAANDEFSISRRAAGFYTWILTAFSLSFGAAYFFMTIGYSRLIQLGQYYIEQFIHGKSGHPRSLASYFADLPGFLIQLKSLYLLSNFENLRSFVFLFVAAGFVFWVFRKGLSKTWLLAALIFLSVDLYSYGWIDVKKDFAYYDHALNRDSPVIRAIKIESTTGRLQRLFEMRNANERLSVVPSANMLYGFDDIGGYSPLVTKRYFESIGALGNVNDSMQAAIADQKFLYSHLPLLNSLGVSHVLSKRQLNHPDFELLITDGGHSEYLYRNRRAQSRAFFTGAVEMFSDWAGLKNKLMSEQFDPQKQLLLLSGEVGDLRSSKPVEANVSAQFMLLTHTDSHSVWAVRTHTPGFFVLTETFYPGWHVSVNGQTRQLLNAYGLFRAVYLPDAGEYQIEFTYRPLTDFKLRGND